MYAVQALLRKNPAYTDSARIEDSIARWSSAMRIVEAQLQQTGGFIVSDRLSLADIVLGLSSHRWFSIPFDKPDLPAVQGSLRDA